MHLAAATSRRPLVEVLADVLESDRPFELTQCDGSQIREDVVPDLTGYGFGVRQGLRVKDDRALEPNPGVLRRAEVGDDRRQIDDRRRLGGRRAGRRFCRLIRGWGG